MLKTELITINGTDFPVNILIEKRRNSRVSIGKGCAYIRIPLLLSREEISKEIFSMKSWIIKTLEKKPELLSQNSGREYKDSEKIKIMNEEYTLSINYHKKNRISARMIGNTIFINISSEISESMQKKKISSLISRLAADKNYDYINSRINNLNKKHFNEKVNSICLKNHKSKWGSCSSKGNINISTRLLFAPEDIINYVCIHELAHLKEKNHSKNFWKLVENAMPDYKEKKRWLKDNGHKCIF